MNKRTLIKSFQRFFKPFTSRGKKDLRCNSGFVSFVLIFHGVQRWIILFHYLQYLFANSFIGT